MIRKYYGGIGFSDVIESSPGIWEDSIVEKNYYGNIIKDYSRFESGPYLNNKIVNSTNISILADDYMFNNLDKIRYATMNNSKWNISSVEVSPPRVNIHLGTVYNE